MPLFTSGASNSILCWPVILLSHVSKTASAAFSGVRRAFVAASRLSGVKLTSPAAVDAAIVPRNPRLYMVRSLVVSPSRIGDIGRWVAIRPIILFPFVVGTGSCVDEDSDVKGLLLRERPGCVKRHVAIDEFGGGAHSRHTSADVVGLRSPDGRRPWRAFACRSVTLGARGRAHARAAGRVGGKRRHVMWATAGNSCERLDR